jgi:methyl-accepting chemotaxis protein
VRDEINSQVKAAQAIGAQRTTVEALRSFRTAYAVAAKESPRFDPNQARDRLLNYVQLDFAREYEKRNATPLPDAVALIVGQDANSLALKQDFILNNPNPLGQKERMEVALSDSTYSRVHAQYHPSFERAQKLLDFYDIFLIDTETDRVVYTVFKELDFASSLTDGIAAKSKLGEAYRKVKDAKDRNVVYLSDFAPYAPDYRGHVVR